MIGYKLIRLIERHADALAHSLMRKLRSNPKLTEIGRVPEPELEGCAREVYQHLGQWILEKTESQVEKWYTEIGARRAAQEMPVAQMVWAITVTKEHLWAFLEAEASPQEMLEVMQELELLRLVEQFFDRAIYYAVTGYEKGRGGKAVRAAGQRQTWMVTREHEVA